MAELLHGSLLVIFLWLAIGGLGMPAPEDLALIATGVLVHRGLVEAPEAIFVVAAGVLCGDTLLFTLAQRLGPRLYDRRFFRRLLPPERRARIEAAFARHGGRLVFFARHVVGLRAAVFAMAAVHGMPLRRFLAWDALSACASVPLAVALGYFGSQHVDRVQHGLAMGRELVLIVLAIAALAYAGWRYINAPRASTRDPALP
jgi:membrane protein DedA with SNARE-associated domain